MSRKAPLSFEEKKIRMLQLFHEKKEFFQLKDLEKMAPKEKGIVANSVKEVISALVDDGSVDTDKIGSSVYFWSFPSKLLNTKKRKLEEIQNKLESSSKKLKLDQERIAAVKQMKDNQVDVGSILEEVKQLEKKKAELTNKIKENSENDPKTIEDMKIQIPRIKDAVNRWTDNIFQIKSWCKKKFMMEDAVLNKEFGIKEDLDYIP